MRIGIDLGTCFSFVAALLGDDALSLIEDQDGLRAAGIPTIIYEDTNGNIKFGEEAKAILGVAPERCINEIKIDLRDYPERVIKNSTYRGYLGKYTAEEVIEMYLTYLLNRAKAVAKARNVPNNDTIEEITITAPVGLNPDNSVTEINVLYRNLLSRVLKKITKLDEDKIHIFGEPEAAALYHFKKNETNDKKIVLVYDLGGGTCDVAIMEYDPKSNQYSLLATGGFNSIGGAQWDNCMKNIYYGKTQFPATQESIQRGDPSPSDIADNSRLENDLVNAKIHLSQSTVAIVALTIAGKLYEGVIRRSEFEDESEKYLEQTMHIVEDTIKQFEKSKSYREGEGKRYIDKVILVGGASQMPQVRNRLISLFNGYVNEENIVIENPSFAIAAGAALHNKYKQQIEKRVNHTYGIRAMINNEAKISNILKKGTVIGSNGARETKPFWPHTDEQKQVKFSIFCTDEMDSEIEIGNRIPAISYTVDVVKDPGETKDDCQFDVTFSVDENNNVRVDVVNHKGKKVLAEEVYKDN